MSGVKYVAASGARMDNVGENKAKFKRDGVCGVNGITFQLTDVMKPLASASRMSDNEDRMVFSRAAESYMENTETEGGRFRVMVASIFVAHPQTRVRLVAWGTTLRSLVASRV